MLMSKANSITNYDVGHRPVLVDRAGRGVESVQPRHLPPAVLAPLRV